MTIQIEIPKDFEGEFAQDKFYSSLVRLSLDAKSLAGKYEKETAKMLIKAFQNAKVVDEKRGTHYV